MASQKLLAFDQNNRIVANADDLRSAIQFSVEPDGGDFIKLKSFRPEIGLGGEWMDICPTDENFPHFAICDKTDDRVILKPARFEKVCYSHWQSVPMVSPCDVFGLNYFPTGHFLTIGAKGGNISTYNREGLLKADGGWDLRQLGVSHYHKTFMFVDPTRSNDVKGQRFAWNFFQENYQPLTLYAEKLS